MKRKIADLIMKRRPSGETVFIPRPEAVEVFSHFYGSARATRILEAIDAGHRVACRQTHAVYSAASDDPAIDAADI